MTKALTRFHVSAGRSLKQFREVKQKFAQSTTSDDIRKACVAWALIVLLFDHFRNRLKTSYKAAHRNAWFA
jgi:hypothetical protein